MQFGLADAVLRPKTLDNRLGFLTEILMTMDYYFFLIYIFQRSILNLENLKRNKHLLRKVFGSLRTSNQIYLLRNCFSNYVYLKHMYITLKGIGNFPFVSLVRILLICKFLNFTPSSLKNFFQSLNTIFRVRKLISV